MSGPVAGAVAALAWWLMLWNGGNRWSEREELYANANAVFNLASAVCVGVLVGSAWS